MNRTTQRTMELLHYIGNNPQGVCLQDIVDALELPKSSAYVILQTLVELNYVTPNKDNDKRYCIGVETFSLGMKYTAGTNLTKQTAEMLAPMAEKYGKTGFAGTLDGTDIVYLQKFKSTKAVLASCELGSRKPAYTTGLGKAIMAHLSPTALEEVLSKTTYERVACRTITCEADLRKQLDLVRQNGYALDIQENSDLLTCCAAPIFDYTQRVVAAVSLSDMYQEGEDMRAVAEELKKTAWLISHNLGYSN